MLLGRPLSRPKGRLPFLLLRDLRLSGSGRYEIPLPLVRTEPPQIALCRFLALGPRLALGAHLSRGRWRV